MSAEDWHVTVPCGRCGGPMAVPSDVMEKAIGDGRVLTFNHEVCPFDMQDRVTRATPTEEDRSAAAVSELTRQAQDLNLDYSDDRIFEATVTLEEITGGPDDEKRVEVFRLQDRYAGPTVAGLVDQLGVGLSKRWDQVVAYAKKGFLDPVPPKPCRGLTSPDKQLCGEAGTAEITVAGVTLPVCSFHAYQCLGDPALLVVNGEPGVMWI